MKLHKAPYIRRLEHRVNSELGEYKEREGIFAIGLIAVLLESCAFCSLEWAIGLIFLLLQVGIVSVSI